MNRFMTLTLAMVFAVSLCYSQKYAELGGFFGVANYQGDLANKPIEFRETKYSFGGFVKYHYSNKVHFRGQLYYARISGDDIHGENKNRDWRFATNMAEASIQMEYLPFGKYRFNRVGLFRPQINPFLTIGIGSAFAINKNLEYESGKEPDIPFPEEGDKNNFLVIPIGAGIRFDFTQWTTLAGEAGWRYAQSDYLDGVSINGNPGKKDWYFFLGFTLSTYIGEQEDFGLK